MQFPRAQGLKPHRQPCLDLLPIRPTAPRIRKLRNRCRSVGYPTDRSIPNRHIPAKNKQSFGALLAPAILPSISLREGDGIAVDGGASMKSKKQKLLPSKRRHISRLERQLAAVEAQIARLEKDRHLGLAQQDHFFLWKRASLFGSERPPVLH